MNVTLIGAFAIIFIVSYAWADCKIDISITKEENDKVMKNYLKSRTSWWEKFKNVMKGRLVDPICTSKEDVSMALCECFGGSGKKSGKSGASKKKAKKEEKEEPKNSCTWTRLKGSDGTDSLSYANLYPCGDIYITQGYAAYDKNVYDVFVVEEKKSGDKGPASFVIKEAAYEIDFDEFKDENHSFLNQLYLQGWSLLFNWDKHLS